MLKFLTLSICMAFLLLFSFQSEHVSNSSDISFKKASEMNSNLGKKDSPEKRRTVKHKNPESILYDKYRNTSTDEEQNYENDLLRVQIARTLGEDFPKEKSSKILKVAKTFQENRSLIDNKLHSKELTNEEYKHELSLLFHEMEEGFRRILTTDEYDKFLGKSSFEQ